MLCVFTEHSEIFLGFFYEAFSRFLCPTLTHSHTAFHMHTNRQTPSVWHTSACSANTVTHILPLVPDKLHTQGPLTHNNPPFINSISVCLVQTSLSPSATKESEVAGGSESTVVDMWDYDGMSNRKCDLLPEPPLKHMHRCVCKYAHAMHRPPHIKL